MSTTYEELRIRGRDTLVPAAVLYGRKTVVTGRFLRVARVMDEELVENPCVEDPVAFVSALRASSLRADILTFAEKPPCIPRKFPFRHDMENWAVLPLTTYERWWNEDLPQETRKNVRRAEKRGVRSETVAFDDVLVANIKRIYDECPVRQGRPFWHYGKDLAAVRRINETYLARSTFVGAFIGNELVGFVKFVRVGDVAMVMQILSMQAHQDARPMNALVAATVRASLDTGCSSLVYGQYQYGNKTDSTLAAFKRRNGFRRIDFTRYFVPLTVRGHVAVAAGAHLGAAEMLPPAARAWLLKARSFYYDRIKWGGSKDR